VLALWQTDVFEMRIVRDDAEGAAYSQSFLRFARIVKNSSGLYR
jgi:hypothetical protein